MTYGIDLGASGAKVVSLRRTLSGFRLVGAARKAGAPTLEGLLGAGGRRRPGVVGLSGRDVNLQVVHQPKTPPINYRMLMRYEVEQRVGTAGDAYGDWCTLREADAYFPQYLALVGLGKKAMVDARLAAAAEAGVDVRDAVPNAFALFAVYRAGYANEPGVTMLLDIGAENADFALVRAGRLLFARNMAAGSRIFDAHVAQMASVSPAEAEALKIKAGSLGAAGEEGASAEALHAAMRAAAGQLVGILQSSVQFAKTQLGDRELSVDRIYLSGGGARLRGLGEYLASVFKVPVAPLDPFRRVDVRAAAGVPEFAALPSDLAVATGLAMLGESDATRVSLVPAEVRRRSDFFRGPFYLALGGAVVAAAMVVATVLAWLGKAAQQDALDRFQQETAATLERIQRLDRLEAEQTETYARTQMLRAHVAPGRALLDAVARLRKILPEGVSIKGIRWADAAGRGAGAVHCVFQAPGRGLVTGIVAREDGDRLTLATGEEFSRTEIAGFQTWTAPAKAIQIEGEVDENIRGGAGAALEAIREQMADPARGVAVDIPYQDVSRDRPSWRVFHLALRCE